MFADLALLPDFRLPSFFRNYRGRFLHLIPWTYSLLLLFCPLFYGFQGVLVPGGDRFSDRLSP